MKISTSFFRFLFLAVFIAGISACGWQLRGFHKGSLPTQMALQSHDKYAPLPRQLQQTLIRRGVTVKNSAPIQLVLTPEEVSKRTVAVTPIGAAAQYQLIMEVGYAYQALSPDKEATPVIPKILRTERTFDFEAGNNLAKAEEERTLLEEMRQELINRILAQSPQEPSASNNEPSAGNKESLVNNAETEGNNPIIQEQVIGNSEANSNATN